jgi:hypothetical protein
MRVQVKFGANIWFGSRKVEIPVKLQHAGRHQHEPSPKARSFEEGTSSNASDKASLGVLRFAGWAQFQ